MRVKFIQETKFFHDGVTATTGHLGDEYDVGDTPMTQRIADMLLKDGFVEIVSEPAKSHEARKPVGPSETKGA